MTAWRSNATARFDTLLLVLLVGTTLAVVRADGAWNPASMAIRAGCEIGLILAVSLFLRRRAPSLSQAPRLVAVAVGAAVAYPFVAELAMRQFADGSEPLEMLLLTGLLLAAVVLAVFSHLPRLGGTAVLLSSFLLLFATTITNDRLPQVLAAVYGVLGLWWLMGAYWDRLAGAFVASSVERRIPVRLTVLGGTAMVLFLAAALIGTTGASAVALRGFMPTSGGTRWHDPHARSGVGDGDAMVAAKEEAMSFGPVESELFLESEMPTLYDMFNDMYGEPPKPKKKQDRAISLGPGNVKETEQRIAKTERSGREFSALRRQVERKQATLDDRTAAAMLYVVGQVPLHLAQQRYDTFDGRVWTHSGQREKLAPIRMEIQNDKPWAYLKRVGEAMIHRGLEPHAVKIINLKTNRFPSPPQLTAVHVDKIDQPDFFGWTEDGVAHMPVRNCIPQLTVIHLRSQGVNLEPLRRTGLPPGSKNAGRQTGSLPHEWIRDVAAGWRQVEAVVERLRRDFIHDPDARAPEDCPDVVAHFLQAGRGPDYLFATTAAVLLRELGYETRLVSGFYARDDRFDHRAGQTSVLAEDVHVWVEVHAGGRTWVAIEPTPGYEPPRESLTWQQRLALAWWTGSRWVVEHISWLLVTAVAVGLLWIARVVCLDRLFAVACWGAGCGSTRRRVLWTLRLLEWRAWLGGHARPRTAALSAWYGSLAPVLSAEATACLRASLCLAERFLYAPPGRQAAVLQAAEASRICSVVRRQVGVRCFRLADHSISKRQRDSA